MPNLTVVVAFTQNNGDNPATGLTLADIDLYLTAVAIADGARTVIWDGTQNPTFEVNNVGAYGRQYAGADLTLYEYVAGGLYTGGAALDQDYVSGGASGCAVFPAGAIEFTYTVTDTDTGLPLDGVEVWISTDAAGSNIIWTGTTDAFGVARDVYDNLPRLDAGTYYFWKQLAGYSDDQNPDTEVVS